MGLLSAIRKRQEEKRREAALLAMNPYILLPLRGEINWMRWEIILQAEEVGAFPKRDGLPVLMTQAECETVNGGSLPSHWGEVPSAWRNKEQKQAFRMISFAYSKPLKRKEAEYPTEPQMEEMLEALESGDGQAVLAVMRKREAEREKLARS